MKSINTLVTFTGLLFMLMLSSHFSKAQRNEGGMRRNPEQMVAAEKKLLYDSLTTLNGDQKLIIDQIYKDYELAFEEARKNSDPNNREAMRDTMMAIREGKDESLKAILTEDQFLKFEALLKARRDEMRQKRGSGDQ